MTNNLKHIIMPDGTKLDLPTGTINDYTVITAYQYGMSQYYKGIMNSGAWLRSNGQMNPKATYEGLYNWALTQLNAGVEGFKSSTASDITDYDFVVNTTDETFRLPLKNGMEGVFASGVKGNGITVGLTDGANYSGFFNGAMNNATFISSASNLYGLSVGSTGTTTSSLVYPKSIGITTDPTKSGIVVDLTVPTGYNLYYYCGNVEEKPQVVNVARIEEELVDINSRPHIIETYTSEGGDSWYEVWSDGKIKQGGIFLATTSGGEITFLKPFKTKILNYFSQARTASPNSIFIGLYGVNNSTDLKKVKYKVEASLPTGFDWEVIGY